MIVNLVGLISGVLFAIGLVISGMVNPNKVKGFLDIFGQWDPSLLFVMGGAVGFNFISFKYIQARKPMCVPDHFLPTKTELDKNLIAGAALFGIGWGLIGICPGPAIVNFVTLDTSIFLFIISMFVGMKLYRPS